MRVTPYYDMCWPHRTLGTWLNYCLSIMIFNLKMPEINYDIKMQPFNFLLDSHPPNRFLCGCFLMKEIFPILLTYCDKVNFWRFLYGLGCFFVYKGYSLMFSYQNYMAFCSLTSSFSVERDFRFWAISFPIKWKNQ